MLKDLGTLRMGAEVGDRAGEKARIRLWRDRGSGLLRRRQDPRVDSGAGQSNRELRGWFGPLLQQVKLLALNSGEKAPSGQQSP